MKEKELKKLVEFLGDPYILKDEHILEPLWPKIYDYPPYSLTVPSDKVNEIKLPKPTGKIFWIMPKQEKKGE